MSYSANHREYRYVLPSTAIPNQSSKALPTQNQQGQILAVSAATPLPSAPPTTASAPVILNAASLAQMLPPPQMISSAANPFVTYPIIQYATGMTGACVHQMPTVNPCWGYGLQGQLMATPVYQMPAHDALVPSCQDNRIHMIHNHNHPHDSHIQPHPNAMLSSLAVAQAYQANMAAMASKQITPEMSLTPSNTGKYRDHAKDPCANEPDDDGDLSGTKDQSFTVKLHRILSDDEFKDYICWMPHGRSWKVLKPEEFEEKVIPLFYRHGKFASFMRQVNGWGFRRMSKGSEKNSYYHEMFLRGFPHLSAKMRRPFQKTKSTPELKTEHPNFQDLQSFVFLPMKEENAIVTDSNHDTSCSDSNGRGGFDTDTTNTGTNDGSGSDRGSLNMSNLCGSSSGGSDRGCNNMYGSGGSDQGSNLYASGGSDQGSNLYGSGGSDQGSNSGENLSSIGDQDSNLDTSNDDSLDGSGSENGCDDENNNNFVSIISGIVDGVEMKSSFPKPRNMSGNNLSSITSTSSETDEKSSPSRTRNNHLHAPSSYRNDNNKSQSAQASRPEMAAPSAKRPRLSPSNLCASVHSRM